ncbi:hypothetical protein Ddye_015751 [Dipteronia dyeriana]|uniref:Uncharacterized protein n=1 Tax=Dipteronia dyeriana TaxID=168575 RepID=A0AAD9U5J3_9ROSI|nr:hypothetical protein Ddye_015751 [Dipteronia dyeriana]
MDNKDAGGKVIFSPVQKYGYIFFEKLMLMLMMTWKLGWKRLMVDGEKFDFDGDAAGLQKNDGCLTMSEKFDGDKVGLKKVERCSKKVVHEACVSDKRNGNNIQLCTEKIPVQQPIPVDDYHSLVVNIVLSVMCLEAVMVPRDPVY